MLEITPDAMALLLQGTGGNGGGDGGADITPPLSPVGVFNNGATSSRFTTNWSSNSEPDLDDYRVYRSSVSASSGFALVGTVASPGLSFNHTGISAETQYWAYVTAVDNAGNESAPSTVATITTEAVSTGTALYPLTTIAHSNSDSNVAAGDPRTAPSWIGDFNWAVPPTTTRSVTVTTMADLQARVAEDGWLITIPSGFGTQSGNVTVSGQNVDVVMSNDATIDGELSMGPNSGRTQYIRWTGGNFNGTVEWRRADDVIVDDVYSDAPGGANQGGSGCSRVAVLNSTLEVNGPSSNNWALHNQVTTTGLCFDWIIANCVIAGAAGGGQTHRLNGIIRCVHLDCGFNPTGRTTFGIRFHSEHQYVWMADSIICYQYNASANVGGASTYAYAIDNGLFERCNFYGNSNAIANNGEWGPNGMTIQNCNRHNTAGSTGVPGTSGASGSGNVGVPWNGVAPGNGSMGAQR